MAVCPEEVIYIANYKNNFLAYLDLFVKKSRPAARGEVRNLESDIYDARMNLKSKLKMDDDAIMGVQEKALREYLLNHTLTDVEKLRTIQFFGMMKYSGNVKNLQKILEL